MTSFRILFRFYLFIFRGRWEGEREGEKHQCVLASCTPPTKGTWPATQAGALDWELNWRPFGSQASTQSTKPHQPGPHSFLSPQSSLTLNKWKVECVCKLYMDQEVEVKILITWCNMGHSHITKQFSSTAGCPTTQF